MTTYPLPVARRERPRGALRTWLDTCGAMVRKEFLISLRYPAEMLASFLQVFLITAVFTLATLTFARGEGGTMAEGGFSLQGIVAYGFIPFIFFTRTLWDIGFNIRREQLQGTLESLALTPASQAANLISRVVATLVWVSLLAALAVLLMVLLMGRLPFQNGWLGAYLLVMTLLNIFGLGFVFAAITLRVRETARVLANVGQFGFMILCAPFFPFAALPEAVLAVSRLIPLAYAVDALRSTLMGLPPGFPELAPLETELWIVSVAAVVTPLVGLWLYQREERRARQQGTLGTY